MSFLNDKFNIIHKKGSNVNFCAQKEVVDPSTPLAKPIETVQKSIETGIDAFVSLPNEDERKKKIRKRVIGVSSVVLVLGGLTMLLNPRSSSKMYSKVKNLQTNFELKKQQSKNNFLKSKFYGMGKKVFSLAEKGGIIYFNFNSMKDIIFQSFCINSNKKYPKILTQNQTVYNMVKPIDNLFVTIFKKPHTKITEWFDAISQYTVKNKYRKVAKNFDVLDNLFRTHKEKLPQDKKILLETKLQEIANARQAFSEENLVKRFAEQEQLMQNLEPELWKSIYTKEKGLWNNPTKFWVQDALITQKEQVQKNGEQAVEKLIGGKNSKGLYDEAIDILRENVDKNTLQNLDNILKESGVKLQKANYSECFEYFDKKRDLIVGSAPTDIVTQIVGLGACGWAVGSANNKEERLQRALTTGLPVATGLASSLVFSALLYSGGVGLIAGAAVSGVTSLACYLINRYVFGNKDQEIDSEEQNKQADKKQVVQEEASV